MFRDNEITSWFYINHNRFALFSLFSAVFFFFTPDHLCSVIRYQGSTSFNSLDIKVNNSQSLSSNMKTDHKSFHLRLFAIFSSIDVNNAGLQPRPQGFSLSHFFREKPWGRGCSSP